MGEQTAQTTKHNPIGFGYRMLELKALGLESADAKRLLIFIAKQRKHRGIAGAVAFCSALESKAKASLNGDPQPNTNVWVAKCKQGFPDSLGYLRKYSASLRRRMVPLKRLFHVDSFTRENIDKFYSTVSPADDGGYEDTLKPVLGIINLGVDFLQRERILPSFTTFSRDAGDYPELVFQKMASKGLTGEELNRKVGLHILKDLQHLMYFPYLHRNIYIDAALKKFKISLGIDNLLGTLANSHSSFADVAYTCGRRDHHVVGRVDASSEPGLKLRVFASPRLIYQAALQPLFKVLMSALDSLPSDCTTNQEEGALWAQSEMRAGKTVHSVDTMAATDSFPYFLQRKVLTRLRVCQMAISLLDHCVESPWMLPREFGRGEATVKWTRGQPLGLLPSFALYAFTHNLLLLGLCEKFGVDKNCFRILGDDIVISDDKIHLEYRKALALMRVGISEMKSFSSSAYAEFAGYYITPDELLRSGKFRPLSADNLLAKITDPRTVYPEILVPKRIRKRMRELLTTEFPKGFLPLSDASINSKTEDEIYDLIEVLLGNLSEKMVHIETETWRCLKFGFDPILSKGYTDTQVHVERWLARQFLPDEVLTDLIDLNRFKIQEKNVVPFQVSLFDHFARVAYHVISNPHKCSSQLAVEIPLLSGMEPGLSRMKILQYLVTRLPISRPPTVVDGWNILIKLQRDLGPKEILETPSTMIRHWRKASMMN